MIAGAVVLGVAIGGVLAAVRSGFVERALDWAAAGPYVAQGRRVPVDAAGRRLYLDCRGSGSPTVILDSGMGGGAGGWGSVLPRTAAITRVCVYDRPGLGGSDSRGRHTAADTVRDLRAALAAAGERGPFVVAGHSLGGVYARIFAATFRSETSGVVLVDAFSPDLWVGRRVALPADVQARWDAGTAVTYRTIESVEDLDWEATMAELAAVRLADLPVIALTQPSRWAVDEPGLDAATLAALDRTWREGLASISTRTRHVIVEGAGHLIQFDRPGVVVDALRELVERGRGGG